MPYSFLLKKINIMTPNIYPKLHLPPDFYEEIGEEMLEIKQWFGAAFVELENGTFVRPVFIALGRVNFEIKQKGYYCHKDTIILAEFTLNRIREVLPALAKTGELNAMTIYESPEWDS
jgi:hypothetical protein